LSEAWAQQRTSADVRGTDSVKITATLIHLDGSPLADVQMYLGKVYNGGFGFETGNNGAIINPTATSDQKGLILFEVPIGYLQPGDEFTMMSVSLMGMLRERNGSQAVFKVPIELVPEIINLDRITLDE
jgi:hypothetical protein